MERQIEGFDYTIDEMGNVYNRKGRRLKPRINTWGYAQVLLRRDHKNHNRQIHQLVIAAFVGPQPKGYDVDHINFNRADNRLENLRYVPIHYNRGYGKKKWAETHSYSTI